MLTEHPWEVGVHGEETREPIPCRYIHLYHYYLHAGELLRHCSEIIQHTYRWTLGCVLKFKYYVEDEARRQFDPTTVSLSFMERRIYLSINQGFSVASTLL